MIKLDNIHKRFGDTEVLKGIDLTINQGEIIVIIGSSGTGKSTLLRCVNFLEQADQGKITIDDISVDSQQHTKAEVLALRRRTGFVFQNYALFAHMTARQNIAEGLITVRGWKKEDALKRAQQILDEIGLGEKGDSYPAALSVASNNASVLAAPWHCNPNCCFLMNQLRHWILNGSEKYSL